MSSDSDRLLIQQIRQGDPQAWESLISRYEGRLLAFVDRRLHDRAASEDVVQESFIGFLNSLPNYDEQRELQTYLFTIASHKLTDHLRRIGRHPLRSLPESSSSGEVQQAAHQPAASSLVRSQERRDLETAAITRCLGQVLDQWRERDDWIRVKVLELLWVKGWANRDVAAFLKISEQQVANFRFAAVRKLSDSVRHCGLSVDVFPELECAPEA
ncbi:MAG TPA: RNA polymerase sigma factor [Gemmataceae bacterium]|nr:RNA polymerase sigma factor [Gemmataceae bacterium]